MTHAVQEAEKLILKMSRSERALLREWLSHDDDTGVFPGIEKTPGVCGGDARVASTRIPVWILHAYRRDGVTDARILDMYPTIDARDLANAWNYADAHLPEIEREIYINEEMSDEELSQLIAAEIAAERGPDQRG